ncbi:hypothetical protein [Aminivibrio pyruvatiphilus]|uniref:hypothetical protein n=1 Tax=Aminivibrio pyruvatiphilus TaxID=1005740 RepID=UPI00106320D6|nr:hypothetical protein [Aminivibrio pyruvatiphilus]
MVLIVAYLPKKQGQGTESGKSFPIRRQGKEFYQPIHDLSSFFFKIIESSDKTPPFLMLPHPPGDDIMICQIFLNTPEAPGSFISRRDGEGKVPRPPKRKGGREP